MNKLKLYFKDKVDGQEFCISGDKHFYLTEFSNEDNQDSMSDLIDNLRNTRRKIIQILDVGVKCSLLTPKERDIFYFRHIDWNSLENCGKQFGVTRERIRQIETKVLEKIKVYE